MRLWMFCEIVLFKLNPVWCLRSKILKTALKNNAQRHVNTAVAQNDTHTHTHTHRGIPAHNHCLTAPGLLRNRIDGTRGPDCVNVSVTVNMCVCVCECMCVIFVCESAQPQKPNICSNDALQLVTAQVQVPVQQTHTHTHTHTHTKSYTLFLQLLSWYLTAWHTYYELQFTSYNKNKEYRKHKTSRVSLFHNLSEIVIIST